MCSTGSEHAVIFTHAWYTFMADSAITRPYPDWWRYNPTHIGIVPIGGSGRDVSLIVFRETKFD